MSTPNYLYECRIVGQPEPGFVEARNMHEAQATAKAQYGSVSHVKLARDRMSANEPQPATPRLFYCKACGNTQTGADCDEMNCEKCGNCDWSPRVQPATPEGEGDDSYNLIGTGAVKGAEPDARFEGLEHARPITPHTATPWYVHESGAIFSESGVCIVYPSEMEAKTDDAERQANMAFIVRAVNALAGK